MPAVDRCTCSPETACFPGGLAGPTTPEDFTSLMDDLEAKIFARFDDDAVVHPGHGDDTTLGVERPHLDGVAVARLVVA